MAASCENWTGTQPPNPGTDSNALDSVAVLSACDAWAVGFSTGGGTLQTLIEHWNGHSWTVTPSPSPGTSGRLRSVRGSAPNDIWAVGDYSDGVLGHSLIEHWNGRLWRQVKSPNPGKAGSQLTGVRAVSGNDAWAVGSIDTGSASKSLILHWNGHAWKQVTSPNPGPNNLLNAVTATSRTDAWRGHHGRQCLGRRSHRQEQPHRAMEWLWLDPRAEPEPGEQFRAFRGGSPVGRQRVGRGHLQRWRVAAHVRRPLLLTKKTGGTRCTHQGRPGASP